MESNFLEALGKPTIAIIGAGAVGGYYGGRLAQHGHAVHFLLRSEYDALRARGLNVRSCRGDFHIPPDRLHVHRASAGMPKADLVIVTLKSTANGQFQELIAPLLHPATTILTLQNGLGNEEALAELFGLPRVIGGIAFTCINRLEPGVIEHTSHGFIRVGDFIPGAAPVPKNPSPRVRRIAELFSASNIECQAIADLRHGRWEKLLWNIPFNGLSAALDLTTDRLLGTEAGLELVRRISREVILAASAASVTLAPKLIEQQIARTKEMGAYRTSSHIDRVAGRPLEVEALFGRPWRIARDAGLATPMLENLYQLISAVDGSGVTR